MQRLHVRESRKEVLADVMGAAERAHLDPTAGRRSCPCDTPGTYRRLSSVVSGGFSPKAKHSIRLGTFLPFDYVELDLVAFFERFVTVQLDG